MNAALAALAVAATIALIFGSLAFSRPSPPNPPTRKPPAARGPSDYYPDPDGSMLMLRIIAYIVGFVALILSLSMALSGAPGSIFLFVFVIAGIFFLMGWGLNRRTTNPFE
jgi:hypothetical protein